MNRIVSKTDTIMKTWLLPNFINGLIRHKLHEQIEKSKRKATSDGRQRGFVISFAEIIVIITITLISKIFHRQKEKNIRVAIYV